jgi:hypothetical protein
VVREGGVTEREKMRPRVRVVFLLRRLRPLTMQPDFH